MLKIFILNGYAGSGKDTFVDLCGKYFNERYNGHYDHYSYVEYTRSKVAPMYNYEGGKTEKDRKFLADLNFLAAEYNDYPFKDIVKWVDDHIKTYVWMNDIYSPATDFILFIDIREPDVIARAVKEFGAQTVLVVNNNVKQIMSNAADASVESGEGYWADGVFYKYDYIIYNNYDISQLEKRTHDFIDRVVKNCDDECIDCNYNVTADDGKQCAKDEILATIDKTLEGYSPKNMVPVSYELLTKAGTELRKVKMGGM